MSLMKLLSMSRSFVSGGGLQGRYKMAEQGMLPKFDAAKPYASSVTPAVAELEEPVGSAVTAPPSESSELFSEPQTPSAGVCEPAVARAGAAGEAVRWSTGGMTVKRGAPSRWRWGFWRRNPFAGSAARNGALRSREGAQGELALDRVRVVRNDLRDTDFEVFRPAATPGPGRGVGNWRRIPGAGVAGAAWNRLSTRWGGGRRGRD